MANIENLLKGEDRHKLTVEEASRGGKASVKARREQKIFKQAIAERMGFDDFNQMVDNLIKRAKDNDKSFKVLRLFSLVIQPQEGVSPLFKDSDVT